MYQLPPRPKQEGEVFRVVALVAGSIALIAILLFALFYFVTPLRSVVSTWWGLSFGPAEVQSLSHLVTAEDIEGIELAEAGLFGLSKRSFPGYELTNIARSEDRLFAVLRTEVTGLEDVYDITGKEPVALTATGLAKVSLTVSPSGQILSWAESAGGNTYSIATYVLGTDIPVRRTEGVLPVFISDAQLLYKDSEGFALMNLANGSSTPVTVPGIRSVTGIERMHYDTGVLSFRDPSLPQTNFYLVSGTDTISIKALTSLPLTVLTQVISVDPNLNVLAARYRPADADSIVRVNLVSSEEETLFTFPKAITLIESVLP